MTVMALDWNATRVRAVRGPAGEYPSVLPLERPHSDLPLAISLEKKVPQVGSRGLVLCRQSPHLVCRAFLPYLTARAGQGPHWQVGRQTLDTRKACELVWKNLHALVHDSTSIILSVPGYLKPFQAEELRHLGGQSKLPVVGSLPATLAAAIAGYEEQFWQNAVIVIDVDDYALTLALVRSSAERAHLVDSRSFPHLGLRFWKERLIDALADMFVWQHRIDPRDVPLAEQHLYDQLDVLFDAADPAHHNGQSVHLGVQAQQWFKHLLVHAQQTEQFCAPLVRQVVQETDHLLSSCSTDPQPRGILLTQEAGRLPGLVAALSAFVRPAPRSHDTLLPKATYAAEEDFGDDLLDHEDLEEMAGVLVLPSEAVARAAHGLWEPFHKGLLPRGHLETSAPLPTPQPADAGPPRLHLQGQDYLLQEATFILGSHYSCHLYFDRREYPDVAARHCEIIYDHRTFVLHNLSGEGTLLNDVPVTGSNALRAGDRIRLGHRGPVLRFLGRSQLRPVAAVYST